MQVFTTANISQYFEFHQLLTYDLKRSTQCMLTLIVLEPYKIVCVNRIEPAGTELSSNTDFVLFFGFNVEPTA